MRKYDNLNVATLVTVTGIVSCVCMELPMLSTVV